MNEHRSLWKKHFFMRKLSYLLTILLITERFSSSPDQWSLCKLEYIRVFSSLCLWKPSAIKPFFADPLKEPVIPLILQISAVISTAVYWCFLFFVWFTRTKGRPSQYFPSERTVSPISVCGTLSTSSMLVLRRRMGPILRTEHNNAAALDDGLEISSAKCVVMVMLQEILRRGNWLSFSNAPDWSFPTSRICFIRLLLS